jgi:S1-C subfamily serine protease
MPSFLKLIVAVFFFANLPTQVHALTPAQVFDKVKDSIVVVKTLDAKGRLKGQGSGVLLPSGKIATNCHVVEGGISYQVGRGNELAQAELMAAASLFSNLSPRLEVIMWRLLDNLGVDRRAAEDQAALL